MHKRQLLLKNKLLLPHIGSSYLLAGPVAVQVAQEFLRGMHAQHPLV